MNDVNLKIHPVGQFDNSAKEYEHITAVPLAAAMGAEIQGIQISALTDESFTEIADALYRHKMLYFRSQELSVTDQEDFTQRFGEFGTDAYTAGIDGHPDVQPVIKEADTRTHMIFGGSWHTDSPFLARPPAISMVFGADIPPYGGDTMWANSALAYAFLSNVMKEMLSPLKVHMSAGNILAEVRKRQEADHAKKIGVTTDNLDVDGMIDGAFHPLVRTHPVTAEKALFVDESYAMGIQGMTDHEAATLLKFIREHIIQPAFTCRLRWEKNTLAIWDNRICLHHAFNDHDGHRRELRRTTVLGEVPK
jgi:alpha-ketoglutarate-dependent taurine dioxygenase